MKKLTILIPNSRPPYVKGTETVQIKNIMSHVNEKIQTKLVWVIFQPSKINNYEKFDGEIINFDDYCDAIEIVDKIKPDIILNETEFFTQSVAFGLAAKFRNIPLVTYCLVSYVETSLLFNIRSKLRILFSNDVFLQTTDSNESMLKFNQRKLKFIEKTLKKMGYNKMKIIYFLIHFILKQFFAFSYVPVSKLIEGDLNLCSNIKWADYLIKNDFKKSSIVVTGDPYLDTLFLNSKNSDKIKNKPGITKILFCTSPMHEHGYVSKKEENDVILKTIDKIIQNKNFEITLKIHPSTSSKTEYEKMLDKREIKIYQKEDLMDILPQFNVMITYGASSVIPYAIILKKPIVFLDMFSYTKNLNLFYDELVAVRCDQISELEQKIYQSMKKEINEIHYKKYIEKHLGMFDGKSSARSCESILKFLDNFSHKNKIE